MTPTPASNSRSAIRRREWLLLALILLLASFLRFYRLSGVPPGVTHDEAAHLHDAQRILHGARPIYLTSGYGREPFYDYVTAPLVGILGNHTLTGRISSALWGLLLILATYGWTRRALGVETGLATALLMAISLWPLSTSRQALRSITMPVLFTTALYFAWRGLYPTDQPVSQSIPSSRLNFLIAGLLLGLSFYTYMPARIAWTIVLLLGVYLALTDGPRLQHHWYGLLLMLVVMLLVAAPLLVYLHRHPKLEVRVQELMEPLRSALAGQPDPLLRHAREVALMFSVRGDTHWMYNLKERPLLPVPLSMLLYAGILHALVRWRRPGGVLLLPWLLVGIAPALVTGLESSSLRAIAAQPAVFALIALPVVDLARWLALRWRGGGWAVGAAFVSLALEVGVTDGQAYFVTWAEHPDVRTAYHAALVEEARYLDAQPETGTVAISTIYPEREHDPYVINVSLRRGDLSFRWFDARGGLVFPAEAGGRMLIPSITPVDPALGDLFTPSAKLAERVKPRPDDLIPFFDVYRWDAQAGLAALLPQVDRAPVCWSATDTLQDTCQPLALPVNVGDVVELVGYDLRTLAVPPGGELELLTVWRVRATFEPEAVLFVHLLDTQSGNHGQQDRLDVPSWAWQPGDHFVQLHRFPVDPDTAPGRYHLQVGVYTREDLTRLPVLVDGVAVDDRILLQPVEVVRE